jgi:mono/diheme cytochrome c family protein
MKALITIIAIAGFLWSLNSCDPAKTDTAVAAPSKDSLIKRGKYLVSIIGCNDCHSPKKMGPQGPYVDTALALSGFPAGEPAPVATPEQLKNGLAVFSPDLTATAGPWGTSFAANITSDPSGIGNWTLAQFKLAMRTGKFMGLKEERMLMPPMPWEDFSHMNDPDAEAIFTYLESTKPVKNVVPAYRPPGK